MKDQIMALLGEWKEKQPPELGKGTKKIDLDERVPDHSTISQLRRRKPAFRKVFRRLFEEVVRQCIEKGLVSGRLAVTDSTHVKANASRASEEQVEMPESPGTYWERLDVYEEEGRTKKWVSRTDPEAGHMKRPGKPRGPYYLSHQTPDSDHGIIIGLTVTPGDVHDTVPYLEQVEAVHKNVVPPKTAAAGLVRKHFCRAKVGTQSDTRLTTRLRGSGGPLPPFRRGLEPQKNDTMPELTLRGVFFLASNHTYL